MVDTRGRMWIVGGETFTHSRHIDMVATFSPDFSNPDVQGKEIQWVWEVRVVWEVWEVREVWEVLEAREVWEVIV